MPHDPYKALYIHIPFCVSRCSYCDFHTCARSSDSPAVSEYIEKLNMQIRQKAKEGELTDIKTIYIGGGTPSHIGTKNLSSLLYMISTIVNLENVIEFTMEANPESITPNLLKDIYALGVDRLSIGVQSFDDTILKMLGRPHDASAAAEAINIAKARFENVSVDLICGIPGQSEQVFKNSLERAINLGVKHVSVYPLTIEPHTPFHEYVGCGQMEDVDPDVQADHMLLASEVLEEAGFEHYEVANYCKPGYESKHNLAYWSGIPYLGIGESATTMTQNAEHRMRVTDDEVEDSLDARQMIAEDLMLAMRKREGASKELVNRALENIKRAPKIFDKLEKLELAYMEDGKLIPTTKGWLCGNELYSRLLELA